jgi:two-component system, chemotaxis family, response regulator Rcp1
MGNRIELLLVEDTPSDIRLTEEALRDSGLDYNMSVVNDGEQAIEYLKKKKGASEKLPDIILLDLNMPKKNGHEVLADMKKDETLKKIPTVLLTVSQRDEDVMEALKLKMNYYLCKPVSAERLAALVDSIFKLNSEEAMKDEKELSQDEVHVRYVLASNPHTSPAVLKKLAAEANHRIRAKIAENPKTPLDVLEQMSTDDHPDVRLGVSENPSTPEHILERLAKDESEDVRLGIAENPRIPARILELLAADENMFVASSAAKTLAH